MEKDKSSDSKQASGDQAKKSFGSLFCSIGQIGLALSLGAVLGFWMADRGIRWFPTMLSLVMVVLAVSLLLIIGGRTVEGTAFKQGAKGLRIRRRMIVWLLLLAVIIFGYFGIYKAQKPSPLTQLGSTKFDEVFKSDLESYRQYDAAIEICDRSDTRLL
ncbi:MAG: hypothetical protein ACYSWP_06825 [Planctomycetota bacterium]